MPEELADLTDGVKAATCPIPQSQARGKAAGRPQLPLPGTQILPAPPSAVPPPPAPKLFPHLQQVWDTHKYIKERGLEIVIDDFVLQVLLNAILGLKGRQETRTLLSALIRN